MRTLADLRCHCGRLVARIDGDPSGLIVRDHGRQYFRGGWRRADRELWLPERDGQRPPDGLILEAPDPVVIHCDNGLCGARHEVPHSAIADIAKRGRVRKVQHLLA